MLRVLTPTYQLRVTVKDPMRTGSVGTVAQQFNDAVSPPSSLHKWFNGLTGKTGCDDALAAVKAALAKAGIEADVWLEQFSHT
jgi:hypothetical protein